MRAKGILNETSLDEETSAPLNELVAELVRQTRRTSPESEPLLDVKFDGLRCIVYRDEVDPPLSPREREIARMVAAGHANKTIAAVLDISPWTVGTHLRRIFAKLGVTSRAAMVARLMASRWS